MAWSLCHCCQRRDRRSAVSRPEGATPNERTPLARQKSGIKDIFKQHDDMTATAKVSVTTKTSRANDKVNAQDELEENANGKGNMKSRSKEKLRNKKVAEHSGKRVHRPATRHGKAEEPTTSSSSTSLVDQKCADRFQSSAASTSATGEGFVNMRSIQSTSIGDSKSLSTATTTTWSKRPMSSRKKDGRSQDVVSSEEGDVWRQMPSTDVSVAVPESVPHVDKTDENNGIEDKVAAMASICFSRKEPRIPVPDQEKLHPSGELEEDSRKLCATGGTEVASQAKEREDRALEYVLPFQAANVRKGPPAKRDADVAPVEQALSSPLQFRIYSSSSENEDEQRVMADGAESEDECRIPLLLETPSQFSEGAHPREVGAAKVNDSSQHEHSLALSSSRVSAVDENVSQLELPVEQAHLLSVVGEGGAAATTPAEVCTTRKRGMSIDVDWCIANAVFDVQSSSNQAQSKDPSSSSSGDVEAASDLGRDLGRDQLSAATDGAYPSIQSAATGDGENLSSATSTYSMSIGQIMDENIEKQINPTPSSTSPRSRASTTRSRRSKRKSAHTPGNYRSIDRIEKRNRSPSFLSRVEAQEERPTSPPSVSVPEINVVNPGRGLYVTFSSDLTFQVQFAPSRPQDAVLFFSLRSGSHRRSSRGSNSASRSRGGRSQDRTPSLIAVISPPRGGILRRAREDGSGTIQKLVERAAGESPSDLFQEGHAEAHDQAWGSERLTGASRPGTPESNNVWCVGLARAFAKAWTHLEDPETPGVNGVAILSKQKKNWFSEKDASEDDIQILIRRGSDGRVDRLLGRGSKLEFATPESVNAIAVLPLNDARFACVFSALANPKDTAVKISAENFEAVCSLGGDSCGFEIMRR